MKKTLLSIIFAIAAIGMAIASPVTPDRAKECALNFWSQNNGNEPTLLDITAESGFDNIYIFTTPDSVGFVILSADDRVLPILGYSFTATVSTVNMPVNFVNWLKGTGEQIMWMVNENIEPSAEVQSQWTRLSTPLSTESTTLVNVVSALLSTTWNQSPYYNNQCPMDGSQRSVTGCTATATAQVMKYHNHPTTGHGSHSYLWGTQTLSANFGSTTYNWSAMTNDLNSSSTSAAVTAVSTLMYHVGVAIETEYGADGSSAYSLSYGITDLACSENALRDYFKYDWGIHCVEYKYFSDQQWKQILKDELNNSRPIIYSGYDQTSGHCFVCDGYNSANQFHFNWGWGGNYDGYYAIGNLNPGSGTGGSSSGTYNLDNGAVIGIKPNNQTGATSTLSYSVNDTSYGRVNVYGNTTMTSYTDTTTILAVSNEGYRFSSWADNCAHNPRSFVGNGGSVSVTANFEPCGGDTLYYCNPVCETAFGSGTTGSNSTRWWGIRIPTSQLQSGSTLKRVMMYCVDPGSYNLYIYQGGTTSPQTLQLSYSVSLSGTGWRTIQFNTPYAIDTTQSLWIVFSRTGTDYPIALAYYAGNDDSNWYGGSTGQSWSTLSSMGYYYSVMIKGIVSSSSTSYYTLTGNASPSAGGHVDGAGQYQQGETATIFALAEDGYKFTGWEDGTMTQPRTVVMNSDVTVKANFKSLKDNTLTYSVNDEYLGSVGVNSSSSIYWAVKFDASVLKSKRVISSIQLFDVSSSSTSLSIYKGGATSPNTLEMQFDNIKVTGIGSYRTYNLTEPYAIDATQPLWIVFECSDASSYPCAYTYYSGNNNGCYLSLGSASQWQSLSDSGIYGSWLIKVITEDEGKTGVEELSATVNGIYSNGLRVIIGGDDISRVRIYDATGKLIVSGTDNAYEMPVAGVYYVVVNDTQTTKIVVK